MNVVKGESEAEKKIERQRQKREKKGRQRRDVEDKRFGGTMPLF